MSTTNAERLRSYKDTATAGRPREAGLLDKIELKDLLLNERKPWEPYGTTLERLLGVRDISQK